MEPSDKSVEIMRKFSEQYARKSGTYFCMDKGVTAVVIKVNVTILRLIRLKEYMLMFSFNFVRFIPIMHM